MAPNNRGTRNLYLFGRLIAALQTYLKGQGANVDTLPERVNDNPINAIQWINRATASEAGRNAIEPIMAELPADIFTGDGMLVEEAGSYWLGYYHQLSDIRNGRGVRAEWHNLESGEKNDTVLNVRIPTTLKQWVDENGGAELVRQLLRDAKSKTTN